MHPVFYLLPFFLLGGFTALNAQERPATVQPTIIVIPFTKEDEDVRTVLEADIARRVAIAKVKEGFDDRGFTTVDLIASLKAMSVDETFTSTDLSDIKSTLIEASRADIYVEVEAHREEAGGGASAARIIMTAYDAFTGRSLGTKTSSSVQSRAEFTDLVENALKRTTADGQLNLIEDFLNVMQEKFTDIVENGRVIKVLLTLDNQDYDFDSETADGDLLSEAVEYWLDDHAFRGNYSDPRVSNLRMVIDEVRIPLKRSNGSNYRPSRFARDLRKFIGTLNLPDLGGSPGIDQDIRGGTIYLSLK